METAPSFYKILTDMNIPSPIRIPEGFMEKYGDIFPGEVVLRNALGATWEVRFEKVEDDCYGFTRGWAEFCSDMGLKISDLVLFSYAGDATFSVSIYDDTALEKLARAFQNPCFHVTLKQHHYYKHHVPERFAVDAGLKGKRKVRLQYCAGGPTDAEVNLNVSNGRVSFGSGWTQFWKQNKLTVGKCYTFEFVAMENVVRVQPHPSSR